MGAARLARFARSEPSLKKLKKEAKEKPTKSEAKSKENKVREAKQVKEVKEKEVKEVKSKAGCAVWHGSGGLRKWGDVQTDAWIKLSHGSQAAPWRPTFENPSPQGVGHTFRGLEPGQAMAEHELATFVQRELGAQTSSSSCVFCKASQGSETGPDLVSVPPGALQRHGAPGGPEAGGQGAALPPPGLWPMFAGYPETGGSRTAAVPGLRLSEPWTAA